MAVKQPFFTADKRDSILSNISSMPDEDKKKYNFIWKAELENGEEIVQFDGRGEEINYGKVRKQLEKDKVQGLYFVPIEAGKNSYGIKPSDADGEVGLIRRAYKVWNQQTGAVEEEGFVARIQADDLFLYVDGEEHTVTSHDENLNTKAKLVDLSQ